jgi:ATP-dependent RNA helicase DDX10/DBP4
VLVKFPNLQELGKKAFVTYLRSVYLKKVFDLSRFSAEQFSAYAASLGLPVTPTIRFISHMKNVSKKDMEDIDMKQMKSSSKREVIINPKVNSDLTVCDGDDDILYPKKPTADANMDNGLDDVLHPKEPASDTDVTRYVPCNSFSEPRHSYLSNLMLPNI